MPGRYNQTVCSVMRFRDFAIHISSLRDQEQLSMSVESTTGGVYKCTEDHGLYRFKVFPMTPP